MAGPNVTGKPKTEDYNLGRGIVYFASLDANKKPASYRDLGNAPEFNITVEVETLEHQSSRGGLKVTDKEVTISQDVSVSFQLDEINHENLASFFSGEKAVHTNPATIGFVEFAWIAPGTVDKVRWYDLVDSAGERLYDVTPANLTLKSTNGTPVTLVLATDYEVDTEMGRIFLLDSTEVGVIISGAEGIDLTCAATAVAKDVDEVRALTKTNVLGALKFIGENPAASDVQTEYQFHQVSLKADGDLALIADEFTVLGFTATAERNISADPDSPTLTIRNVQAA